MDIVFNYKSYGVSVSTEDFKSFRLSSTLSRTSFFVFLFLFNYDYVIRNEFNRTFAYPLTSPSQVLMTNLTFLRLSFNFKLISLNIDSNFP